MEVLQEIRFQLGKVASRKTSISCFRVKGNRKLELVWVVGSKRFYDNEGQYMTGTISTVKPSSNNKIQKLAAVSGLLHDIGKATKLFQDKLKGELPTKDPVRHEWVSAHLVDELLSEPDINKAFENLNERKLKEMPFKEKQKYLNDPLDVLKFVIATHHGLFAPKEISKGGIPNSDSHFRTVEEHPYHQDPQCFLQLNSSFDETTVKKIKAKLKSFEHMNFRDPWEARGTSLIARAMLILADHTVSSRKQIDYDKSHDPKKIALLANTTRDDNEKRVPNQDLNYHLKEVAHLAGKFSYHFQTTNWPGLDQITKNTIMTPSDPESDFNWQNKAVHAIKTLRESTEEPILILNNAGTGAGKTRMNAKAIAAASTRSELRFTTALGLRTLTLQTGDAYAKELDIPKTDLNCVIGSQVTTRLHQFKDDEDNSVDSYDSTEFLTSSESSHQLPEWLQESFSRTSKVNILTPPVLVSTIDYLNSAGEPHRQGHHAAALIRLANSDLVIDEVDDYGPDSFIAVCRIVEMAALLGANVVCSSATLPAIMAEKIFLAFQNGLRMRASMKNQDLKSTPYAIIDNFTDPKYGLCKNTEEFNAFFKSKTEANLPEFNQFTYKSAKIVGEENSSFEDAVSTISESISVLHEANKWSVGDKHISLGLIRVTFVKDAIRLARALSAIRPDAYIATYHSREFLIQRHRKEKILDSILSRKKGNENLLNNEYVQSLIAQASSNDIPFIVIATPVEEVGRDHDFDWGIIEPNSARSIVQTAGRINRHRKIEPPNHNIHILDRSFRCLHEHGCGTQAHYKKPGFETYINWPQHDMTSLILESEIDPLNSTLRYGNSPLAELEDDALSQQITGPIKALCLEKGKSARWMTEGFYQKHPLREHSRNIPLTLKDGLFNAQIKNESGDYEWSEIDSSVNKINDVENSWLNWSIESLLEYATKRGVSEEDAFHFEIYENKSDNITYDQSFGIF